MRWYVIQVRPGLEAKMQMTLQEKIVRSEYSSQFGKILNPTEEVVEMKGGKQYRTTRKFFPSYLLIEMEFNDDTWAVIAKTDNRRTSNIIGFLGGDNPAPLSDKEVNDIMERMQSDRPKPKTIFEQGQMLRIVEGPFVDFNGVVEEVNYDKNTLKISVLIFGRSTSVELDFSQVEKVY